MNIMKLVTKLKIKWQIIILSLFFISASSIATYTIIKGLDDARADSALINVAGRQRMLTQKFTKSIFLKEIQTSSAISEHIKSAKLFEVSLDALIKGGQTFSDIGMKKPIELEGVRNPEIIAALQEIKTKWQAFHKEATGIITQASPASDKQYNALNQHSNQILGAMHATVGMIAKHSQSNLDAVIGKAKIFLLITFFLGCAMAYFIFSSVSDPLVQLGKQARSFSDGRLDKVVPPDLRSGTNEVSYLARSTETMRIRFSELLGFVQGSSLEMQNTAQQVTTISKDISSISEEQNAKTNDVKHSLLSLLEIAQIVESEIQRSSEFISHTERKTQEGIETARDNIQKLDQAVESVVHTSDMMEALSLSSEQMNEIVDSIQNIAEQTNLLALNAAIEAARAGEQGRGFAVVADEVRTLAARTSSATDEIRRLIGSLGVKVNQSVDSMSALVSHVQSAQEQSKLTIEGFEKMGQEVMKTAESNRQVSDQNTTQSERVKDLSTQFEDLFAALKNNELKADSTSLVAENLHQNAEQLRKLVSEYRINHDKQTNALEHDERREASRFKSNIGATLYDETGNLFNGFIENISLGGCRLIARTELTATKITIALRKPSLDAQEPCDQETFSVHGEIVHSRNAKSVTGNEERYSYGVKFDELDYETINNLTETMQYFDTRKMAS